MKKLIYLSFLLFIFSCSNNKKFDKEIWSNFPYERKYMIDDLVNSHLVNKNINQTIEILGETDTLYHIKSDSTLNYFIGMEDSYIAVDGMWLNLKFTDSIFTSFKTRTD